MAESASAARCCSVGIRGRTHPTHMEHIAPRTLLGNVANTFAVNGPPAWPARSTISISTLGAARIGLTHTQRCTRNPRMDQLAVVKSNTNTEGESFVGLHTLMYRVRRVDERHIRALGNAHYNDYAAANVKSMTSDTCFFQTSS